MRRRKRLKKIFILPPVLLAALLIWLVISQRANSRPEAGFMDDVPVEHFWLRTGSRTPVCRTAQAPGREGRRENLEGLPEEPVLKIERRGKRAGTCPDRIMSSGICPAPVIRESCPCCSAVISICRIRSERI